MFIVGIDPGKEGAIVVLDGDGEIFYSALIPYQDKQTNHKALAIIFREIQLACEYHGSAEPKVKVYLEKIYTRPEDSGSENYLKSLEEVARESSYRADCLGDRLVRADEAFAPILDKLGDARRFWQHRDRRDGRVGILNYSKSTGILFMGAMLGWEYEEVSPKTWGALIKKGAPEHIDSKEKSKWAVAKRDEKLLEKGSSLWAGARSRGVHMGKLEAYLIAIYGRISEGLEIVEAES